MLYASPWPGGFIVRVSRTSSQSLHLDLGAGYPLMGAIRKAAKPLEPRI